MEYPVLTPDDNPGTVAAELYFSLGPWWRRDIDTPGRPLLKMCMAIGGMLQDVDDIIRDTDDGPGWSIVMDVTRSPSVAWLLWLQQFYGARVPSDQLPGESDADYLERVRSSILATPGFRRGTLRAIEEATKRYMVVTPGDDYRYVINERPGDNAWQLQVSTAVDQSPDPDRIESAIIEQKPAGIILSYNTYNSDDFDALRDTHSDFDDITTTFADFTEVATDPTLT